jgi:hypothetical protein
MSREVEHVVFFNFGGEISQEQENLLQECIAAMKVIPGLIEISFGKNISPARAQGYTHGLRARLENKDVLPIYASHETHQKFVSVRQPLDKGPVICLDWEL